jgi:hypothetical protein
MARVSLLPHRSDWTELERDAVAMLECHIANRGEWRPGDVERTPLTLSHIQWWLGKTGARRRSRDYAREVLATLVGMGLLRDTGEVLTPRRQPRDSGRSYWWRVFEVLPITKLRAARYAERLGSASPVSLYRFARCQGLIPRRSKPRPGSVQWAFMHTGPP